MNKKIMAKTDATDFLTIKRPETMTATTSKDLTNLLQVQDDDTVSFAAAYRTVMIQDTRQAFYF